MGSVLFHVRAGIEAALRVLDLLPAPWALLVISILSGIVMLPVLRLTLRPARLEHARDQLVSAIYEVRLFLDAPRRVLSAQGRLLYWNARYLLELAPALLVLTVPMLLLCLHLETRFGLAPLPLDQPAIVEVDLDAAGALDGVRVEAADPGLVVTAPPLRDREGRRVFVRVEPREAGRHVLRVHLAGGATVEKAIAAGPGAIPSAARVRGAALWLSLGAEPPLPEGAGVAAIRVTHADREVRLAGIALPWWAWWLLLSTATVLLLARRFGVRL